MKYLKIYHDLSVEILQDAESEYKDKIRKNLINSFSFYIPSLDGVGGRGREKRSK